MWQQHQRQPKPLPGRQIIYEELWDRRTGEYRGKRAHVSICSTARLSDYGREVSGRSKSSTARFDEAGDAARLRVVMFMLRLSLALVFFWFGALKIMDVSPVMQLLQNSFPFLAASPYIELLGLTEIFIAVGLMTDRLLSQTIWLMTLHLLGTLAVVAVAPRVIFAPAFPVLTMEGEFVAKNFVLIAAGLVVGFSRRKTSS